MGGVIGFLLMGQIRTEFESLREMGRRVCGSLADHCEVPELSECGLNFSASIKRIDNKISASALCKA